MDILWNIGLRPTKSFSAEAKVRIWLHEKKIYEIKILNCLQILHMNRTVHIQNYFTLPQYSHHPIL